MTYTFPTVDALARELARLEATHHTSATVAEVPPDPVEFARAVGIEPDPWQREVLSSDHPRKVLCCSRRAGKTLCGAILAIHRALTVAGSDVLVVAPSEDQAKILFAEAARLYRLSGAPYGALSDRRTGLELGNNSTIEARTALEKTTRGRGADLLIFDEAARVLDQDYYGVLPTIAASKGDQVLLSTPYGRRGFFHDIWHDDKADFHKVRVTVEEVPHRVSPEFLEDLRLRMPLDFFRQEFMCEFLDAQGSLFAQDDIDEAIAAGEDIEGLEIEWQ